jgi:hypothetical protein
MLERQKQISIKTKKDTIDINNLIQGLWIGPRLSRFEYNSIKSYIKQGYEYHLYTYDKVENVPPGVVLKDGNEILNKKYIFHYESSIAPFSDLFRYKLLYERGGVWTDCDIICVKRLPYDVQHKYIFVAERTILKGAFASCLKTPPYTCKKKKVLNSLIRTPPHAPIMLQMFEKSLKYRNDYLKSKGKSTKSSKRHSKTAKHYGLKPNIGLKSYHWGGGSKTLETLITKNQLEDYIVEPEFAFPINWWDFKYAFENMEYIAPSRGWTEGTDINDIFKKSGPIYLVTIHNGWLKNHNMDKNASYHVNSLFERLDRYIN